MMEREDALRHALSSLAGEFGRESMLSLRRFFSSRRQPVISSGSLKLDQALEIGGLPRVRTSFYRNYWDSKGWRQKFTYIFLHRKHIHAEDYLIKVYNQREYLYNWNSLQIFLIFLIVKLMVYLVTRLWLCPVDRASYYHGFPDNCTLDLVMGIVSNAFSVKIDCW